MKKRSGQQKMVIGWREWVQLPDLGVSEMKAKVDTGADNSSLHAFNLERFERDGVEYVRFEIHPKQRSRKPTIHCEAPLAMEKKVKNPGGRTELRPVIRTGIIVAGEHLEALVNLTSRDEMGFRMLLGRRAVRSRFVIDPGRSYVGPRPSRGDQQ
ncbi:MAG TPA: RimK/LysX family protein [Acidimicrobiia bacterium]|nr:RimK/LysX family protein [Acidimicrobiia bacterium]